MNTAAMQHLSATPTPLGADMRSEAGVHHDVSLPGFAASVGGRNSSCISSGCFLSTPQVPGAMPILGRTNAVQCPVGDDPNPSSSRNQGRRKGGVTVRTKQQQQQQQHTATLKSSPLAYTGGAGRLTLVMTKPAHDDARTSRNRAEDSHPGRGGESSKSPPTRTARHISKQTARAIIGAGGHAMLRGWNGFEEELKQNCVGREGRDTMHYAGAPSLVGEDNENVPSHNDGGGSNAGHQTCAAAAAMARSLTLGSTRDSLLVVGDKTPDYPLGEQEGGGTSSRKSRDLNDNRLWQHDDNQASNKHCAAYDPVTLSKEEPAAFSDRLVISLPKPTVPSYSLNVGSGGGDDDDNNDDGGTKFCTNSFKNDPKPDSLTKRSRGGSGGEGRGDAKHSPVARGNSKRVKTAASRRLQGIIAAYTEPAWAGAPEGAVKSAAAAAAAAATAASTTTTILPSASVTTDAGAEVKLSAGEASKRLGEKRGRSGANTSAGEGGCGPSECRGGGSSGMAWRYGTRVGLSGARLKKLETAMEAAMEHLPVTYEEHARQERLAHFRMMYMSHRTIKRLALSRWGMALERLLADKFAEDMLRYEHSRLAGTLSAAKQRWEEKIVRRRFSLWRRSVRLARTAEREPSENHRAPLPFGTVTVALIIDFACREKSLASDAADTIQRWARRRLAVHRRDRMRRRREQRLKEEAREKSQAVLGVFAFEDDRRCYMLEVADAERQELRRRRIAEHEKRWKVIRPLIEELLSATLDRSARAALAKTRAHHKYLTTVYLARLAEHMRMLNSAHAVLVHTWRGKLARLEYSSLKAATVRVQRGWRQTVLRWSFQRDMDARIQVTRRRIAEQRCAAATRIQLFLVKQGERHRLNARFKARKAKLEFERRNRAELASAVLVLYKPSATLRDYAERDSFQAMDDAVRPAVAVARIRALAESRGGSLEDVSTAANAAVAAGTDGGFEGELDERLRGELARAVVEQDRTQKRAAALVQGAWRRKQARREMEERCRRRKIQMENDRRERGARQVQQYWKSSCLRGEINTRVERARERTRIRRDIASKRLQKLCRDRKGAKELKKRFVVRKIILEQARSLMEMNKAVAIIQLWYRRRLQMYYTTLRIVARYQLSAKRAAAAEEEYQKGRVEAITVIQLAWRKGIMRAYLRARFEARRARLAREKEAATRLAAALLLQGWWRRFQAQSMLKDRFAKRADIIMKQMARDKQAAKENAASSILQRAWVRHTEWEKMRIRFCLRKKVLDQTFALEEEKRLEAERLEAEKIEQGRRLKNEHEATKVKLLLEEAEKKRKADEAASYMLKAWKLGFDMDTQANYWFNHITGESSTTRPEGWEIKPADRWLKQMNSKGVAFYLDQETGKTHWFPPCEKCYKREGERTCDDCDGQIYCPRCYDMEHKPDDMRKHKWKGADSGKDDLAPGERHCVDCGYRKAKWMCLQCKDALCQECSARIHGSGHRKNHLLELFAIAKKGWQAVEGRTDNEPTFYFNATTNESKFDKPQELMLPEELAEHKRFLEYKATSERYVKKIEKLQFQLEELMYEKDKIAYQWANAEKDMKARVGDKLPGAGGLLKVGGGSGKKKKPDDVERTPAQEEAYKKSLLFSRKDKKDMGFEVKLKKSAILDP